MSPELKANWETAATVVDERVPAGSVTTYGDVAEKLGYARRDGGRACGSMMRSWESKDPDNLSHRVVDDDGTPASPAHEAKLRAEGVTFDAKGRVDLTKHRAAL